MFISMVHLHVDTTGKVLEKVVLEKGWSLIGWSFVEDSTVLPADGKESEL